MQRTFAQLCKPFIIRQIEQRILMIKQQVSHNGPTLDFCNELKQLIEPLQSDRQIIDFLKKHKETIRTLIPPAWVKTHVQLQRYLLEAYTTD